MASPNTMEVPILGKTLADEARSALAAYEAGLQNTPREEIERMIGRLATLFPAARVSDAEAEQRLSLYTGLLEDIPADILAGAFRAAAQTCTFFPAVAEIRKLAEDQFAARRRRRAILRAMVKRHDHEWTRPLRPEDIPTQEEIDQIKREAGIMPDDPAKEEARGRSVAAERESEQGEPVPDRWEG